MVENDSIPKRNLEFLELVGQLKVSWYPVSYFHSLLESLRSYVRFYLCDFRIMIPPNYAIPFPLTINERGCYFLFFFAAFEKKGLGSGKHPRSRKYRLAYVQNGSYVFHDRTAIGNRSPKVKIHVSVCLIFLIWPPCHYYRMCPQCTVCILSMIADVWNSP